MFHSFEDGLIKLLYLSQSIVILVEKFEINTWGVRNSFVSDSIKTHNQGLTFTPKKSPIRYVTDSLNIVPF